MCSTEQRSGEYPMYLYEFRYRCERTGKWRKARYRILGPAAIQSALFSHSVATLKMSPPSIRRPAPKAAA